LQPTRAAHLLLDGFKIEPCTIIIMVLLHYHQAAKIDARKEKKNITNVFIGARNVSDVLGGPQEASGAPASGN
jgi:hypothetical protein